MVSVVDGGEGALPAGFGRVSRKAENGLGAVPWSLRRRAVMRAALGLRVSAALLCLVSFSVMVADNIEGWAGDSFARYSEYRYEPMFSSVRELLADGPSHLKCGLVFWIFAEVYMSRYRAVFISCCLVAAGAWFLSMRLLSATQRSTFTRRSTMRY